jgi:hypothetical protein
VISDREHERVHEASDQDGPGTRSALHEGTDDRPTGVFNRVPLASGPVGRLAEAAVRLPGVAVAPLAELGGGGVGLLAADVLRSRDLRQQARCPAERARDASRYTLRIACRRPGSVAHHDPWHAGSVEVARSDAVVVLARAQVLERRRHVAVPTLRVA